MISYGLVIIGFFHGEKVPCKATLTLRGSCMIAQEYNVFDGMGPQSLNTWKTLILLAMNDMLTTAE
jgi:hypothetical protein